MDYISIFLDIWEHHRGKIIGVLIGLAIGIGIATLGFWKTILLVICIFIGYIIGKKIDAKENLRSLIDKVWQEK